MGYAEDMLNLYQQWAAIPSQWPSSKGPSMPERLGPASCNGDDQCLGHYLLSRSNGSIGLDARERFFASAATPINATAKAEEASIKWPIEGPQNCGSDECRVSRKLRWRRSLAQPANGRLVRSDLAACRPHEAGPMVIHFNGPLKSTWESAETVANWFIDHLLEQRE